jgi:hypothetical protein
MAIIGLAPRAEMEPGKPAPIQKRDIDPIAYGKVACVAFGDALKSPGLAGLTHSYEDFLKLVYKAADEMVEYTFRKQKEVQ